MLDHHIMSFSRSDEIFSLSGAIGSFLVFLVQIHDIVQRPITTITTGTKFRLKTTMVVMVNGRFLWYYKHVDNSLHYYMITGQFLIMSL